MIGYVQARIQVIYLESYIYIARAHKKIVYIATVIKLKCAGIWVTM